MKTFFMEKMPEPYTDGSATRHDALQRKDSGTRIPASRSTIGMMRSQ
jgi:hypothetical protein